MASDTHHSPNRRCRPDESRADYLLCLPRGLIPMVDDHAARRVEKVIALLLVAVWAAVFLGLSFEAVEVVEPRFWGVFSAIVFVLVGKLWDLEVEKYLPGNRSQQNADKQDGGDD